MKTNLLGIITIVLISLLIGGVAGYLINYAMPRTELKQTQIVVANEQNNVQVQNVQKNEEVVEEQIKFDGEKSIIIDGNKYTIGYKEELLPDTTQSSAKKIQVKLYVNNKKAKTAVVYDYRDEDEQDREVYTVELKRFCKDYILVILGHNTPSYGIKDFYIFNKEGQYIDGVKWSGKYGIYDKDTKQHLTYKLDENSLTIYKANIQPDYVGEYKYTVLDEVLETEYIKTYENVTISQ